jgi:SAM-dependent methyltransferase
MTRKRPTSWLCGAQDSDAYDAYFERLAAQGKDIHGEANFVAAYGARSVLDGGCGTGRVARELARRGMEVVGVDIDAAMLATAQRRSPELEWVQGDLATVDLGRAFDLVLLAGNVMIYLQPGSEGPVLANLARHLTPDGRLVAGFQLDFGLTLTEYDRLATAAGLKLSERWATWDRQTWVPGGNYAVSVHRR